ncbi:hypothetical protein [Jeongeupia naejangsanensis]|uniref:DUF5666 domain-containing protein n=1 Tax=Jeongeupia naejangsanensis TaxID=613195 RepID=A0ABS2BMX4_9NEIS|nr:hypothetical protein [Jeongeupia naejangsanensis]MBM3116969.1 hypothetical protein [Jeongeupia naejangsanensis]
MRTLAWFAIPVLAAVPLLAACAAPGYTVGQTVTADGTLVLIGNEPFPVPTLLTTTQQWELSALQKAQYVPLQNKTVRVRGVVERTPSSGALRPRLKVIEISEQTDAK